MVIVMYAPAITDALERKDVGLDELRTLREHAYNILNQQGDLEGALKTLEQEVRRRK